MPSAPLLLVDDEPDVLDSTAPLLRSCDFRVETAGSREEALRRLGLRSYAALICDLHLPTEADGLAVLKQARAAFPLMPVLMLTGGGSISSAVAAMRAGATDYLCKPIDCDRLASQIRDLVNSATVTVGDRSGAVETGGNAGVPRPSVSSLPGRGVPEFVGHSPGMRQLLDSLPRIANTRSTVLILGESGTGKTLTARALHQLSPRADKPFVEIACGSLSDTLLESELFGHVQGSFTGATHDRAGKFLLAEGGTLFLDEIGTASPQLQVKLLRVLQDRAFEPVGGTRTHRVDVRLILATNSDLEAEVRRGGFRADLYYRINVITLVQPPLRERVGDISLLARHHLERVAREQGRTIGGFTSRALAALEAHPWPGNVRELVNAVERGVVLCPGELIDLEDLPEGLRGATPQRATGTPQAASADRGVPESDDSDRPTPDPARLGPIASAGLRDALDIPERRLILDALIRHRWNRQETAQGLGINRTTLYKKMKRLGISVDTEVEVANMLS